MGGMIKVLVSVLKSLNISIEYIFIHLLLPFVVLARKEFKGYDYMQYIVIASNAVYAIYSLVESIQNIRKAAARWVLEDTGVDNTVYSVDIIFGLYEG